MIEKCIDYLNGNGYYGNIDSDKLHEIAFKFTEQLCNEFSDKDGGEVPDEHFYDVLDLLRG